MDKHISKILKNNCLSKNLTQEQVAQRVESENDNNIKIHTLIKIVEKGLDGKVKIEF